MFYLYQTHSEERTPQVIRNMFTLWIILIFANFSTLRELFYHPRKTNPVDIYPLD